MKEISSNKATLWQVKLPQPVCILMNLLLVLMVLPAKTLAMNAEEGITNECSVSSEEKIDSCELVRVDGLTPDMLQFENAIDISDMDDSYGDISPLTHIGDVEDYENDEILFAQAPDTWWFYWGLSNTSNGKSLSNSDGEYDGNVRLTDRVWINFRFCESNGSDLTNPSDYDDLIVDCYVFDADGNYFGSVNDRTQSFAVYLDVSQTEPTGLWKTYLVVTNTTTGEEWEYSKDMRVYDIFETHPENQTCISGQTTTFSTDVALRRTFSDGSYTTRDLSYEWFYADSPSDIGNSIADSNSKMVSVKASSSNSGKYYWCRVMNNVNRYSRFSDSSKLTTKYSIKYNANGGSNAPASQTKKHNNSITLSKTKPAKSGYNFKGWATSSNRAKSGTVDYAAGATYSKNANVTLYAVWKVQWDGQGITWMPLGSYAIHNVDGYHLSVMKNSNYSSENNTLRIETISKNKRYKIRAKNKGTTTLYLLNSSDKVIKKINVNVYRIDENAYYMTSKVDSDYVLDIQGGSKSNSAQMIVYKYNGKKNQQYRFMLTDAKYCYAIECVHSSTNKKHMVVDVKGGSADPSTPVIQYEWKKGYNQRWEIRAYENNYISFINAKSGLAFDIKGGKVKNSAKMIQYQSKGSSNQLWKLVKQGDK